jgi:hypothetical protein
MGFKFMMGCDDGKMPKTTALLSTSRYGTPRPELLIELAKGADFREVFAVAHYFAACANLRTPKGQGWVVQVDADDVEGRAFVSLELVDGTDREVAAGMALLRALCE